MTVSTLIRAVGMGADTWVQAPPAYRSMSACGSPLSVTPTAQMSCAETPRTLRSSLKPVPGLGLGTTVQAAPSQCSTRAGSAVWPLVPVTDPTAQTSHDDRTVTALSSLLPGPGLAG